MIHIEQAVIVEGKYDKIKLSSIIDATIIETGGFSIFKDKEKLELIKMLARKKGILIITDSDAAGFKIRNYIGGALPKGCVKHAYIPDILGKEPRKAVGSKEGKLGVEGIPKELIIESLERAGVMFEEKEPAAVKITKNDLYEAGLTGGEGSADKRRLLLSRLNLPQRLSTNAMLDVMNMTMSYDEYKEAVAALETFEKE